MANVWFKLRLRYPKPRLRLVSYLEEGASQKSTMEQVHEKNLWGGNKDVYYSGEIMQY